MVARCLLALPLVFVFACAPSAATKATSTGPKGAKTETTPTASASAATTSASVASAASAEPALDSVTTADPTSTADASRAPSGTTTGSAAPSSDERLARDYPGARVTHNAGGRHWHSEAWASTDSPAKVRAYYRRYAAQNAGFKLTETPDSLSLDGGAAMGLITVRAASGNDKLQPGELTVISSSRP